MADFVNAIGLGNERSGELLRNKWKQLKYRSKQKAADITIWKKETRGGSSIMKKLTEQQLKIISLIGTTCFNGIVPDSFDSTSYLLKATYIFLTCGFQLSYVSIILI